LRTFFLEFEHPDWVYDMLEFGAQQTDISYGRSGADKDVTFMSPTPEDADN
jgi:hypothetical protein